MTSKSGFQHSVLTKRGRVEVLKAEPRGEKGCENGEKRGLYSEMLKETQGKREKRGKL